MSLLQRRLTYSEAGVGPVEEYLLRERRVGMSIVQLVHGRLCCILWRILVFMISPTGRRWMVSDMHGLVKHHGSSTIWSKARRTRVLLKCGREVHFP